MTLESLGLWERMRAPESHWRRAARETMIRVVREQCGLGNLGDNAALLEAIDAAYPFGERKYLPYKMWLLERAAFRAAMSVPPAPSRNEAEVCSVARDELELHPERADEIRRMLDEHAPNRLGRRCPACGARPGQRCASMPAEDDEKRCTCQERASCDDIAAAPQPGHACRGCGAESRWLIVPHEARLVGHLGAGPLFEARS